MEGWKKYHIEDFGKALSGTTPSTKNPEYYGNGYKFIGSMSICMGYPFL